MNKISYWLGAVLGAGATAGYLLWEFGWPSLEPFILVLLSIVVASGAILGGGVVLSWRHVRRSPRILRPILIILVVLSLFPFACFQRDRHQAAALVAEGDSVRGEVTGRNLFGNLLITFPIDSARRARMVAPKKRAHERFVSGDSIWIYRERVPPYRVEVWPPGPDWRVATGRLLWFWGIAGVLLAGYGPLLKGLTSGSKRMALGSSEGAA